MASQHDSSGQSLAQGRWLIVVGAFLWSTSGGFTKALIDPTPLGLNVPTVSPLQIAFYRTLFAGLVLAPFVRPADVRFRPAMLPMTICFAAMNAMFLSAMALGPAANAIVLQYTAPMWMVLASVWLLKEPADRRSFIALGVGLVGICVIVLGGWQDDQLRVVGLGLGSGFAYGVVVICLRALRNESAPWMTVLNHLVAALALLPFVWSKGLPGWEQLGVIFLFGSLQMAVPYWLVARGLRSVSPQEAGIITLMEPILNPFWAYLVSGERPPGYTMIGGVFILGALAWRYLPTSRPPDDFVSHTDIPP